MSLKVFKPYTKTTRGTVLTSREGLWRGKPHKPLTSANNSSKGRNNNGRITSRNHGGGHKHKYRHVDFYRKKSGLSAQVERIEYDPNRSAHIALLLYKDGERRYIIAPSKLKVGDEVISADNCEIKVGNSMKLKDIPLGTNVHCVELKPLKGAQLARSAGTSARLVAKEGIYATLRLQSGETRKVLWECRATLGTVSNQENNLKSLGKAGAKRWRGVRPTVRGVAMNPVDHPHGGGEGRTSGGRHPSTPWGVPTKGYKTRKNQRTDDLIIRRRGSRK
jgi:large subunit ribosomal protein L2